MTNSRITGDLNDMNHVPALNDFARPMLAGEARALLREAVKLNIQHERSGARAESPWADERDMIVRDLTAAGFPANYADFEHPRDVR